MKMILAVAVVLSCIPNKSLRAEVDAGVIGFEPEQTLDAKARRRNLLSAFALAPGAQVQGRHLALVDDVLTTGATAHSLAQLLMEAGARQVDVYCLARTPKPGA